MKRKWYNCKINELDAQKLKAKLKEENIKFETSGVGCGYVHFEIFCNDAEVGIIDNFLMEL